MPFPASVLVHWTNLSLHRLTSKQSQQLNRRTQSFSSSRRPHPPSPSKPSHSQHQRLLFCATLPLEYLAPWFPGRFVVQCSMPFIDLVGPLPPSGDTIVLPVGRKPSHLRTFPLRLLPVHLSQVGFPVLEFHPQSQPIAAVSSSPPFRTSSCT